MVRRPRSQRDDVPADSLRILVALVVLREQVIKPLLAGVTVPRRGRKPKSWTPLDDHYETLRQDMQQLFTELGIAA